MRMKRFFVVFGVMFFCLRTALGGYCDGPARENIVIDNEGFRYEFGDGCKPVTLDWELYRFGQDWRWYLDVQEPLHLPSMHHHTLDIHTLDMFAPGWNRNFVSFDSGIISRVLINIGEEYGLPTKELELELGGVEKELEEAEWYRVYLEAE